jgi:hypothetical protein
MLSDIASGFGKRRRPKHRRHRVIQAPDRRGCSNIDLQLAFSVFDVFVLGGIQAMAHPLEIIESLSKKLVERIMSSIFRTTLYMAQSLARTATYC